MDRKKNGSQGGRLGELSSHWSFHKLHLIGSYHGIRTLFSSLLQEKKKKEKEKEKRIQPKNLEQTRSSWKSIDFLGVIYHSVLGLSRLKFPRRHSSPKRTVLSSLSILKCEGDAKILA
ncbi:hypothetical protein CEXT_276631 [Caerostris extrusa]|uniref:Uncharacterized protein n=1 Tax=Caerostris extrusa TaxID=172846 RepID=A0AAV4XFS6_CAEEX|nr:hypothetical protein CEXT_276631 [Caerostris extrusa]